MANHWVIAPKSKLKYRSVKGRAPGAIAYWHPFSSPAYGKGATINEITAGLSSELNRLFQYKKISTVAASMKVLRVCAERILGHIIANCPVDDLSWASKKVQSQGYYRKKELLDPLDVDIQGGRLLAVLPPLKGKQATALGGKSTGKWIEAWSATSPIIEKIHTPGQMKKYYYAALINNDMGTVGLKIKHLYWDAYVKYVDEEGGTYVQPYLLTRRAIISEMGKVRQMIKLARQGRVVGDIIDMKIANKVLRREKRFLSRVGSGGVGLQVLQDV